MYCEQNRWGTSEIAGAYEAVAVVWRVAGSNLEVTVIVYELR